MSRILEATCVAGVVTAEGVPVPIAEIFSAGIAPSEGLLIMQDGKAFYITSNAEDIEATLDGVSDAITSLTATIAQLITTFGSFAAAMTGPTTAPPPTLAAELAVLTAKSVELTATKAALELLKAGLK
jgi:hypothetical protein